MIAEPKTRLLAVAETAKLVRLTLKRKFPLQKFSVRSISTANQGIICVRWNDGPLEKEVEQVAKGFEGYSFDGMNDSTSLQDSWLLPDGTAELAYRPDTYGGSVPGYVSDAPHPDAELVNFGVHYVYCCRDVTDLKPDDRGDLREGGIRG